MINPENLGINVRNIDSQSIILTPGGVFEVSRRGNEVVLFTPSEIRRVDPLYVGRDSTESKNIHDAMKDGVLWVALHYENLLREQELARSVSDRRFFGLGRISRLFS